MSRFSNLEALRARLMEKTRFGGPEAVEARLAGLIDALEAAWQRAETEIEFGTYTDNHADMQNLALVKEHLETVARSVEAACNHRLSYYRW
jgi:hypothetical protein